MRFLIDALLLGKRGVEFPVPTTATASMPDSFQHPIVGRAHLEVRAAGGLPGTAATTANPPRERLGMLVRPELLGPSLVGLALGCLGCATIGGVVGVVAGSALFLLGLLMGLVRHRRVPRE